MSIEPVRWVDGEIEYVDQRSLPARIERRRARTAADVVDAIATLAVRGAPCIGVFGAYGVALVRRNERDDAGVLRRGGAHPRSPADGGEPGLGGRSGAGRR